MPIPPPSHRKMGFTEKINILFHYQMASFNSVVMMIKLNTIIDFQIFKPAWAVLFFL